MASGVNIAPGFVQLSFYMQHAGISHTAVCVLGAQVGGAAPGQSQFDAMLTAWATAIKPLHDSEVTYSRLVALHNRAGTMERWESVGAVTGTRTTTTILPPNNSYLIRKPTLLSGRRFRGRLYIPYVSGGSGVDQTGTVGASDFTLLTTAAAAIKTQMIAIPTGLQDLALLHSADPSSAAPAPTIISSLAASNRIATQRRRLKR